MAKIKNKFLLAIIGAIFCFAAFFGGMTAFKASANTLTPTVTIEYGASIRIGDEGNGLRFSAKVANPADGYEYHMIIVPDVYFSQDVYTNTDGDILTKLNAVHKTLTNNESTTVLDYTCTPDTHGIIRACITNIAYSNSNLQFTGIAYVKQADGAILSYSDKMTRSVTQVASYALMDKTETYSQKAQGVLFDYIHRGYHEAVGTNEAEAKADNLPELTIAVAATVETSEFTGKAGEITGYKVMYNDTELPELNCIVVPKTGDVDFENGKITLKEDTASGKYAVTLDAPYLDEVTTTATHTNMNLFSQNTSSDWEKTKYNGFVAVEGYNTTEKAMVIGGHSQNRGMTSDYSILTYPIEKLQKADENGYTALSFQVKINQEMADNAYFEADGYMQTAGIRIFATDRQLLGDGSNRHGYVIWNNDQRSANANVVNQGEGVSIYKDVFAVDLSTTEYTQVVVNLEDFLALRSDTQYLAFAIGALNDKTVDGNSQIFMKDTTWLTAEEYTAYLETEKSWYASKNYVAENMLGRWHLTKHVTTNLSRSYDTTEKAIKFEVVADNNNRRQNVNTVFLGNIDFKHAQELGLTSVSITYKVNETKRTSNTENSNRNGDFLIHAKYKTDGGVSNVTEIEVFDSDKAAGEWITTTVNLSDILLEDGAKYVMLDIGGFAGSAIWLKEMKLC